MRTILVTGINGFLGSSIAKRMSEKFKVIGTEYDLTDQHRISGYNFKVYGNNLEDYKNLFNDNKIDIIIHTATFYGRNNEELIQMLESNLISPFQLLDYAIKNNCKLFINTDSALERYTSVYSLTKKQFLDWLKFRSHEIKTVNMQLEHFYGPGTNSTNFITLMIQKLINNEPKIDLTLGEQKRDFIYYEDIVDAYELVINYYESIDNTFSHYEVGSGESTSIKDLILLLKKITKSDTQLDFGVIPYRENELMISKANLEPIKSLGWTPKVKLIDGIQRTLDQII